MNIESTRAKEALLAGFQNVADANSHVDKGSPLMALLEIDRAQAQLERAQTQMVIAARAQGHSWAVIGRAIGTSAQNAHQRYRDHA